MSEGKPFRLVDPVNNFNVTVINWEKCVICQADKLNEKLICPANNSNNKTATGIGYDTLCTNSQGFCKLDGVITNSSSSSALWRLLVEDGSPAATFQTNEAK